MNTCILFTTKHGAVEKCARTLQTKLGGEVRLVNLMREKAPDLAPFDTVILGCSIYMGRAQGRMSRFVAEQAAGLAGKKLGLFICCGARGDEAMGQLDKAYPESLRTGALAREVLGDAVDFDKVGFFTRMIVKKTSGKTASYENFDEAAIDRLVAALR